ncbi:MAG: hypothetical protein GTN49_02265 [candidate division Zixibacteria bacterium]|nr:hypothetical protein [candidate division Zixibacteria bacterium]
MTGWRVDDTYYYTVTRNPHYGCRYPNLRIFAGVPYSTVDPGWTFFVQTGELGNVRFCYVALAGQIAKG